MGQRITRQEPVQLFFAIMAREDDIFARAEAEIEAAWSPIHMRDDFYDFDPLTTYYKTEFGTGLRKRIVAVRDLIDPEELVDIKIRTNEMEDKISNSSGDAPRIVNIDPGYLNFGKIVLASTKDHWHRLYIGQGIFAELTLRYQRAGKGYTPLEWTYPDYKMPERLDFFARLRQDYRERLRASENQAP